MADLVSIHTSLREYLDGREKTLVREIASLREELVPLESELADVRKAKSALAREEQTAAAPPPASAPDVPPGTKPSPYQHLTMKELTLKALKEKFPMGATANDLLEFFGNAWGRTDVVRSSLSPQLSRLKWEGKIGLDGYVWFLLEPPKKVEAPTEDQSGGASDDGGGGSPPMEGRAGDDLFGQDSGANRPQSGED
jgi:hypothetical protein